MYSNFNPWEFKQNHPFVLREGGFGPYAFSCFDPFVEKIFLNLIPSHFVEGSWKVVSGAEITVSWLEDNLATLDFFASDQSIKVLMAEQMPQNAKEFLLNEEIEWGKRFFLMSFSKEDKFFEKCKKSKNIETLKVNEPKFWEYGKLLKFLCETTGIYLPVDVQNYILDSVPNEPGELILAMKKLALLGSGTKQMKVPEARELLGQSRIDQFDMAKMWGDRDFTAFYKKLLILSGDFEGLMFFFKFMQGHIIKMLDTSYLASKNRPSKYDKQIESQARRWNKAELADELRFFGECEILAKGKSVDLSLRLREKVIFSYS